MQRLESFLKLVGLPSKNQYGFQGKTSTYMAIANVMEEVTSSRKNKSYSLGVFLDLSKAFDTVDHTI